MFNFGVIVIILCLGFIYCNNLGRWTLWRAEGGRQEKKRVIGIA